jgi:hypothetical protein
MKKSLLVRLGILFLTMSTLSACLLVPVDEGNRGGGHQGRDRGEHRGDRHEGPGDRR